MDATARHARKWFPAVLIPTKRKTARKYPTLRQATTEAHVSDWGVKWLAASAVISFCLVIAATVADGMWSNLPVRVIVGLVFWGWLFGTPTAFAGAWRWLAARLAPRGAMMATTVVEDGDEAWFSDAIGKKRQH